MHSWLHRWLRFPVRRGLHRGFDQWSIVAESGRQAERRLAKEGVLAKCSVQLHWYRSLSTSLVPPEGFEKLLHFGKIPKKFGENLEKIQQNFGKICGIVVKNQQKFKGF